MPQFCPNYDVISKKRVFTEILTFFRPKLGDLKKKQKKAKVFTEISMGPFRAHGPPKVHGPQGHCTPLPSPLSVALVIRREEVSIRNIPPKTKRAPNFPELACDLHCFLLRFARSCGLSSFKTLLLNFFPFFRLLSVHFYLYFSFLINHFLVIISGFCLVIN